MLAVSELGPEVVWAAVGKSSMLPYKEPRKRARAEVSRGIMGPVPPAVPESQVHINHA